MSPKPSLFVLAALTACASNPPEPAAPSPAATPVAVASSPPAPPPPAATAPAPPASASAAPPPPAAPADPAKQGPTYSVFVLHTVKDLPSFRKYLEDSAELRKQLGAVFHVVSSLEGEKNKVMVHYIVRDLKKVEDFLKSPEMAKLARQPGAPEQSQIIFTDDVEYQPVTEWQEVSYSVFYKFEVKDFDAWRSKFDQNRTWREKLGIIGYGVHKARGEDRTVIVHIMAKTLDTIREMAAMPEIKTSFKDAGIKGTPKPLYARDVEVKRY